MRYGKIQPGRAVAHTSLRVALELALWLCLLVIPGQILASVLADLNHQDRLTTAWGLVPQQLASPQRQAQRDSGFLWRDGLRVVVSAAAVVWVWCGCGVWLRR